MLTSVSQTPSLRPLAQTAPTNSAAVANTPTPDGVALGQSSPELGLMQPVAGLTPSTAAAPAADASSKATVGDWAGFQTFLDKNTGSVARPGSSVTPLIDGQTAFPKMLDTIDNAKSSVNWSVFEFDADKTGEEVAQHLAAAADRGVNVRLLYDGFGSKATDSSPQGKQMMQFLKDHNVQIEERKEDSGHITHRKILTVDGTTGFIGGMNVGDDYSTTWHDIHSEVTGPAVGDLQNLFVTQWKSLGGNISDANQASLFPKLGPTGDDNARIIGHIGGQDQRMKKAYLQAIDTSEKSITIADPYVTDEDVFSHLCEAAKRGVDVRLILPQQNDQQGPKVIEHTHYAQLADAGVKIYEYKGRPMAHDKVGVFDHRVATIGSSNLDTLSLQVNDEANVWVDNTDVAGKLESALVNDESQSDPVNSKLPGWIAPIGDGAVGLGGKVGDTLIGTGAEIGVGGINAGHQVTGVVDKVGGGLKGAAGAISHAGGWILSKF